MLTLDRETKSALHYDDLNSSIKDTFATIDQFELQAVEQVRVMHDERMYRIAGYKNFEQYCQGELHVYGGYRRINQLLGASKVIVADAPNNSQQIVSFSDGERLLVNNADINDAIVSESTERTYPKVYAEVIAALKEQHKQELERLSQELRIGLQAEVNARAEAQTLEQIQSLQNLYRQQKEQNIQLQQRLDEMEGLRKLSIENQQPH